MKINHDPETDSLYIHLSAKPGVDSKVLSDNIVVDIDEKDGPVGIDIQYAGKILNLSELVAHNIPAKKVAMD